MATLTTIVRGSVADGWISTSQTQPYLDNSPGLDGYLYRAAINITAGVGAGVNYQQVVKCYFGNGVNGTEVLNGETVAKVYLVDEKGNSVAQTDFDDVRFALQGSTTEYVYKRTSKTDSDNAVFIYKPTVSLDSNQIVYCYYGNASAVDASSDNALVDVVGGVVGAWSMDEALATDPVLDYSGNSNDGTATETTVVSSKFTGKNARYLDGIDDKIVITDDASLRLDDLALFVWYLPDGNPTGGAGTNRNIFAKGDYWDANMWALYNINNNPKNFYFITRVASGAQKQINYASTSSTWINLAVTKVDGATKLYVDNVERASGALDDVTSAVTANIQISAAVGDRIIKGTIAQTILFNSLTVAQISNMYLNYPDVTLVAGSVLVRKWATTTLPTVGSVNSVEKRDFNLAYKINQVTSPAQAAGKDYWVATAHDGNNDVAVIVTEV